MQRPGRAGAVGGGIGHLAMAWRPAYMAGMIDPTPIVSLYPVCPDDPGAVVFDSAAGAVGDGHADNAPALQRAIDRIATSTGSGIIFFPPGMYALRSTVNVWRGIRLIGFGEDRPVLWLPEATPGFAGAQPKYLLHYRDAFPKAGEAPTDAMNTTFFSGLCNFTVRLGEKNPAAVAVRFRVAQLCSIEHVDFHLGSSMAAIEAIGNEIESCHFFGGRWGMQSASGTSAGWQTLVMNCQFHGQAEGAIETERAGVTLFQCAFAGTPRGVVYRAGKTEQLVACECSFEDVGDAAIVVEREDDPATQVNLRDIQARNTPVLLRFVDSGRKVRSPGANCRLAELTHGRVMAADGAGVATLVEGLSDDPSGLTLPASIIPTPPDMRSWRSAREFGAVGDGRSDDTAALRRAIAHADAIYLPMGVYRITDTLELGPNTALIGLHPERTKLVLPPNTPGFGDPARPRDMVLTPPGGRNIIAGLCVDPGKNPGAVGVRWRCGQDSLADDLWFEWGGHGADAKARDFLQSIWIDGGGGVFKNIWSANMGARDGFRVSDSPGGSVFLLSVEHHLDVEVSIERSSGWRFVALQTEENRGSENATAVQLRGCSDVEFWNLFLYRVMSMKSGHPQAVDLRDCRLIRFRGIHSFSWGEFPFTSSVRFEQGVVADRELARLDIPPAAAKDRL